jgi:putative peptidoglycan lipid II flippase
MCLGGYRHIRKLGYFALAPRGSWLELWGVLKAFLMRLRILMLIPVLALAVEITEKMVSSTLGTATLASVDYAKLVTETFVLLLAMPIGLASLASFAIMSEEETTSNLRRVLQPLLIASFVAAGLVAGFSTPIVEVLYSRGAFDSNSVQITSAVLSGLGIGLWAQLCSFFTLKVLNARHRNRIAVTAVASGAVVTVLARPFLAENFGPFGMGLAVSLGFITSLSICLAALRAISIAVNSLLISTPPLLLTLYMGFYIQDGGLWPSLGMGGLAMAFWTLYLLAIPLTRQTLRGVLESILRKE